MWEEERPSLAQNKVSQGQRRQSLVREEGTVLGTAWTPSLHFPYVVTRPHPAAEAAGGALWSEPGRGSAATQASPGRAVQGDREPTLRLPRVQGRPRLESTTALGSEGRGQVLPGASPGKPGRAARGHPAAPPLPPPPAHLLPQAIPV